MADGADVAERFEELRPHLRQVAYRILGSVSEAQDAVAECYLRLRGSDPEAIRDLRGWLTVVVGRICLDALDKRRARREDLVGGWLPEPLLAEADGGPEEAAVIADSVGIALLIVLDTLGPVERLAFVLHDVFGVPFGQIAPIVGRSADATRQLARRARSRIRSGTPSDTDPATHRRLVDAFLRASREGDFGALLSILHDDVVFRVHPRGGHPATARGAAAVARQVLDSAPLYIGLARPALVDGRAGAIAGTVDDPAAIMDFGVVDGRIATIDIIADRGRLAAIWRSGTPGGNQTPADLAGTDASGPTRVPPDVRHPEAEPLGSPPSTGRQDP